MPGARADTTRSSFDPSVAESVAGLDRGFGLVIGGRTCEARSGRCFENFSPVTMATVAEVPDGTGEDVALAVDSAESAFQEWRSLPPQRRAQYVREIAALLRAHADELAVLDTLDVGNPIAAMRRDVQLAAEFVEMFADWALALRGETFPASRGSLSVTVREPFGVVARIVAFNHPLLFAASKLAAPLVAGNTVVLKPSDGAPLSALRLGALLCDILPPGVVSVVVGRGIEAGDALVRDSRVRRIGFTGSVGTGLAIQRAAADGAVKTVTLELGGKNALIACPDSNLGRVADAVVAGMNFRGVQGQSCGATSRLLVHETIKDELLTLVFDRIRAIRVGSPLDPDTEMGTMASRAQYDRVHGYLELAREEGATVIPAGGLEEAGTFASGLFIEPTVLDDVTPSMRVAREEIFGPILTVMTWREDAEAVQIANSVDYGLTAAVWTADVTRAHRFARELAAGYVWINGAARHFPGVPFGGTKNSGVGREESLEELLSYTELKAINILLEEP